MASSRRVSQRTPTNRDHALGAAYPVTLPAFQGPLDLLLHLIEREELDISEISLVAVTDQYVKTLETLEEIEPGALADFLVVASRLLLIKSNRLLPKYGADDEEEDAGDSLVQRLIEYRQFKRIAGSLREREETGLRVYVRGVVDTEMPNVAHVPDFSNVDLASLYSALKRALQRIPAEPRAPSVLPYTVTVAEQVDMVRQMVIDARRQSKDSVGTTSLSFSKMLAMCVTRVEILVTFLAVLELIKQEELVAVQEATFGEITLLPLEVYVPGN